MGRHLFAGGFLAALIWGPLQAQTASRLDPAAAARQADQLLTQELSSSGKTAARTDDPTFARRITLDLIGRPPTPEEVTAFVLDPSTDKRDRLVRRLLANPAFGQNWGRYWRDVILFRSSDPRALISASALERYLTEQFNKGTSWREIAKSFITATGDVRENGATALIMAQQGMTEETTAEVSRIFMGIQIQCAQCHDHPTDRWKRKQFHELAAFFPRIAVRPKRDGNTRSFEVVSVNGSRRFGRNRGQTEHYMPDLENPSSRGALMTPRFFLSGRTLKTGSSDEQRRSLIANWVTTSSNPWFAKAFVNRLWAEMVGEGFFEPVDDMGPDRTCSAPGALKFLAEQFTLNQHDVKWLYQTIAATEAYQRKSRDRRNPEQAPFAANCPQRLRGDQLYSTLTLVLGQPPQQFSRTRGGIYGRGGPRTAFNQTFGFDPSDPREEVAGSIPQALYMMNSPLVSSGLDSRRSSSPLGRLLREISDDEEVVVELYLRCLSREPTDKELKTCLSHRRDLGDRNEAFEDVLWALINSTEFLYRK